MPLPAKAIKYGKEECMGQKDLAEKSLEAYPDVFADCVNALLYRGRDVLKAQNLQPAPTETFYSGSSGKIKNQLQDVSKYEMAEDRIRMQYNIENETKQHRKMLLRKAGYEGGIYRSQYEGKTVYPVASIVLYWGKRPWRSPCSMHRLMGDSISKETEEYIDDIKLHVYEMAKLPLEIRKCFKSDMRIIVDYLAEGSNYRPSDHRVVHIDALLRLLRALTGDARYEEMIAAIQDRERKEGITMCELLDKYENRGIQKGIIISVRNLMSNLGMSAVQAMEAVGIPQSEQKKYLEQI